MEVVRERSCILPTGLLPGRETCVGRVHDTGKWLEAEDNIAELISRIQPNEDSWKRRKAIADYIQSLIGKCFPCQVFIFGSVPLKTSLPDGDIDLTVLGNDENLKDTWTDKVYQVMKEEEKNENAEFHLTDVHRIAAGVKVIKCLVENIVVDISFNQIGGLGTLCFLEEMDHLINKGHLFKRSVILIKAWCYYESRILGAHHGLISTYALETLILYIFHVFDNSFTGPLEVLYRFLEIFSNFDWDKFCVSIWGPVPIHLLPEMSVIPPRKDSGELFHKKFFLKSCSMFYDILAEGEHTETRSFVSKYFNVVDPLCMHNNLGRSVCKGNFFRIRSAFEFGAKKLAGLLDYPKEKMISELTQFFTNTWKRDRDFYHNNSSIPSLEFLQPSNIGESYISTEQSDGSVASSLNKAIHIGQPSKAIHISQILRDISNLNEQSDDTSEYPSGKHVADFGMFFYGASSQILRIISQRSKVICSHNGRTVGVCHSKKQDCTKVISKYQDHVERTLELAETYITKNNHENFSPNSNNIKKRDRRLDHKLCMFCSAKKCFLSSPVIASDISFVESQIIVEKSDNDALANGSEYDCRSSCETVESIDEPSCSRKKSYLQTTVSNGASDIYHDNISLSVAADSMHGESENCRIRVSGKSELPINKIAQRCETSYTIDTGRMHSINSQQRAIPYSGLVPSALYPTGPPVPFLEMLQTYNVPSQGSFYGGLYSELDGEAFICDSAGFNRNANLNRIFDQHEIHVAASAMGRGLPQTPAMLNLPSEWLSHNVPFIGPSAYPYPTVLPMVIRYFQGDYHTRWSSTITSFPGVPDFACYKYLPRNPNKNI